MLFLDANSSACPKVDLWLNGVNVADVTVEALVSDTPGVPEYGWVKMVSLNAHGRPYCGGDGAPLTTSMFGVVWWRSMSAPAEVFH